MEKEQETILNHNSGRPPLRSAPSLALIVPCYNEEEAFAACLKELNSVLEGLLQAGTITDESYILFVDDGSRDKTWSLIKQAAEENKFVRGLKLSRNRGQQIAMIAGLAHSDADVTVSIDADLQDDTNCITQMVDKYREGYDIVYGVRNDRSSDSLLKKVPADCFYRLMSFLGIQQIANHSEYRLLSREVSGGLLKFKENNIYLRGLIPLVGFRSSKVYFRRRKRIAGETKYPLRKLVALAVEAITSFSIMPLRLISALGFFTCFIALIVAIYTLFEKVYGHAVTGWASMMIAVLFLGGVQLLSLGVVGEYIGKIYMETKARPKYFIDDTTGDIKPKR